MKLFILCDGCGCDLLCIHIGISHRNFTEWVWNPFMCDIAHRNALYAEQIAPREHFHKPTYNPFHEIKSHVKKCSRIQKESHRVNEPEPNPFPLFAAGSRIAIRSSDNSQA